MHVVLKQNSLPNHCSLPSHMPGKQVEIILAEGGVKRRGREWGLGVEGEGKLRVWGCG